MFCHFILTYIYIYISYSDVIILPVNYSFVSVDLCGYSGQIADNRIIGGEDTTIKRWPWQVMLIKLLPGGSQLQHCGGTLVTTKHVLTAAHCFTAVSR